MGKIKEQNKIGIIAVIAVFLMLCMTLGVIGAGSTQSVAFATGSPIDELTIPAEGKAVTIVANDGTFKMPSITGLTFKHALNDKTMYTSYSASQSVTSATFDVTNVAQAVASIKAFTYTASDTIMTIDVKVTSGIDLVDGDVYFNGHVYRHKNDLTSSGPTNMWEEAYTKARATTAYGATGYLTNVTSAEENTMLLSMLQTSSSTWDKAYIGARLTNDDHVSKLTPADIGKFSWADGPEQGEPITAATNFFHSGEPNADAGTMAYLYIGWEGPYWDDLANTPDKVSNREVTGYIIEFNLPSATYSTVSNNYVIGVEDKDYQSIALTPNSFNKDVIAEGATNAANIGSTINHFVDGSTDYCYNVFYASGFSYNGTAAQANTGFPSNNTIVGLYSDASYIIAPYTENNVAYVSSGSQHTMTFAASGAYSDLVFLSTRAGTSAGTSTLSVEVNFSDGTKANSSFAINNWYTKADDSSAKVYLGQKLIGRVRAGTPASGKGALGQMEYRNSGGVEEGAPYLKECYMDLSSYKNRLVESVTIKAGSDPAGCYVFAIAGKRATTLGAPVQSDITSISKTGLTANWNSVAGATGYVIDVATNENFNYASMVEGYNNLSVGNVTTKAITGLSAGAKYYVRVRAINESGQSFSSNVKTANLPATVTFDLQYDGAPTIPAQNIDGGTTASEPVKPTRAGHIFGGWFREAACTNAFSFSTTISEDMTLYAKWSVAYEVSFDLQYDGAPSIPVQVVATGTTATEPADPTRSGYIFDGWYGEAACTTEFDFDTTISASKTIYAKWRKVYEVSFNLQYVGAPSILTQVVDAGATANEPVKPTRTNYIFDGWYEEAACTTEFEFDTEINEDVIIYAKWLEICEVSFDLQYEAPRPINSIRVGEGKKVIEPSVMDRYGYEYGGWYREPACTNAFDFDTTAITSNVTLYAKWIKEHYVLVLNANGGEGTVSNINVEHGQSTDGLFPTLTKRGQIIKAWECDSQELWAVSYHGEEVDNKVVDLGNNNGEYEVVAIWTNEKYNLHYNPNGGTCKTSEWVEYSKNVALPEAVKEGSTFIGWYTKDGSVDNDWGSLFSYYIDDLGDYDATIELYARYTQDTTFAITGKVVDKDGDAVSGAMVMLKAGNTTYATLSTDAQGEFDIQGLAAKLYQMVVVKSGVVVTRTIDLQASLTDFSVDLPDAKLISIVEVKEDVPEVVIDGLHDEFTEDDQTTASETNKSVELKLIVESVADSNEAINNNLGGFTLGFSLDISIVKTSYNAGVVVSTGAVSTTGGLIKIIVPLPQVLQRFNSNLEGVQ